MMYQYLWNWVVRQYGEDVQLSTWEELRTIKPESQGRLSLEACRTYSSEFKLRLARLEKPPGEEVTPWVLSKIPDRMRTAMMKEQPERNREHPCLKVMGVAGIPLADLQHLLTFAIGDPHHIARSTLIPQDVGYLLELSNATVAHNLPTWNGNVLNTAHTPIWTRRETREPRRNFRVGRV